MVLRIWIGTSLQGLVFLMLITIVQAPPLPLDKSTTETASFSQFYQDICVALVTFCLAVVLLIALGKLYFAILEWWRRNPELVADQAIDDGEEGEDAPQEKEAEDAGEPASLSSTSEYVGTESVCSTLSAISSEGAESTGPSSMQVNSSVNSSVISSEISDILSSISSVGQSSCTSSSTVQKKASGHASAQVLKSTQSHGTPSHLTGSPATSTNKTCKPSGPLRKALPATSTTTTQSINSPGKDTKPQRKQSQTRAVPKPKTSPVQSKGSRAVLPKSPSGAPSRDKSKKNKKSSK